MRGKGVFSIHGGLIGLLLIAAAAAMAPAPASAAVPATCFNVWHQARLCAPSSTLFPAERRSTLPLDWWQPRIPGEREALLVLARGGCEAGARAAEPRLADAIFGDELPQMRVDFANFKLDMDVDANLDGLRLAGVRFGYQNCWP